MRALSSRPFCSCAGCEAGLWYLPARWRYTTAFFLLLVLGIFYWSGWLTWAILIFFLTGFKHEPALNEVVELTLGRRLLGAFAFLLLVVIMAPVPHQFMQVLGLACPYV